MIPLTAKQHAVYELIRLSIEQAGVSPTHQEMSLKLGINESTVNEHLGALVRKGWIRRTRQTARGIALAAPRDAAVAQAIAEATRNDGNVWVAGRAIDAGDLLRALTGDARWHRDATAGALVLAAT